MALTNLLKKLTGGRGNGVVEGKMCRTHSTRGDVVTVVMKKKVENEF